MIMLVVECRHHWSVPDVPGQLNIDHPVLDQIFDTYLRAWSDFAPLSELRGTLLHALRIAPLRRSQAWMDNLAHADQHALTKLGHLPWTWLEDLTLPVKARDAR